MKKPTSIALCLLVAAGLYWFAQAGDMEPPGPPAPTMKTLDEIEPGTPIRQEDTPLFIASPGRYFLVEDISADGVIPITITSDRVDLDLKGFSIQTNASSIAVQVSQVGVYIDDVTIHDGIMEGNGAVYGLNLTRLTIRRTTMIGGLNFSNANNDCVIEDNLLHGGAYIAGCDGCRMIRNTIHGGILCGSGANCSNLQFRDNVLPDSGDDGLNLGNSAASVVADNAIYSCTNQGIQLRGSTGVIIRGNTIDNCGTGIEIGYSAAQNQIENNLLTSNNIGLSFHMNSHDNVYRANTARGNDTDFVDSGGNNTSHGDNYMPNQM